MFVSRVEMESSAEHLAALRKLQRDLQEQREEQEDLFESRREVMPRLAKEERGLLQDQAGRVEERWSQEEQVGLLILMLVMPYTILVII